MRSPGDIAQFLWYNIIGYYFQTLKQKQMDLMSRYERAQQALTLQALQQYQQLLNNIQQENERREQEGVVGKTIKTLESNKYCEEIAKIYPNMEFVEPLSLSVSMTNLLNSSMAQQKASTSKDTPPHSASATGPQPLKLKT